MRIEIGEKQEQVIRDALEMWLQNLAQDCDDDGEDDLAGEALELAERVNDEKSRLHLYHIINQATRIDSDRVEREMDK